MNSFVGIMTLLKGAMSTALIWFNGLYHAREALIPVAFELIRKPIVYYDIKTRKKNRLGEITKNELQRLR